MNDHDIESMVEKICVSRPCPNCPLDGYCQRPWTDEDRTVILESYEMLFGVELNVDSDELVKVLEDG